MKRVKNLKNSGISSPWVKDNRPKNNDDLSYLPGIGEKAIFRIREFDERVRTIFDFKMR